MKVKIQSCHNVTSRGLSSHRQHDYHTHTGFFFFEKDKMGLHSFSAMPVLRGTMPMTAVRLSTNAKEKW